MTFVFLNGSMVPEEDAVLPVNDRAILFGDGAYETMRSYSGRFFRFAEHLGRLRETLNGIQIELAASDNDIVQAARDLVAANLVPDARVRLTVTGGVHGSEIRLKRPNPPNWIMTAVPLTLPSADIYRKGVHAVVSPWRVQTESPLPRIKTINRLRHLMAKEEALDRNAWDALFCDQNNSILEGTMTNVFFVIDGTLRTPALTGPLLAGVTRDAILELAEKKGVPCQQGPILPEEAQTATEGFFSGTTIELLPITTFEDHPIGAGVPGPVWKTLHTAYREAVTAETGITLAPLG